ncbi:glycerol-3-phosphate acyltransferase 2, mitochondrial [Apus apus]|uniref:glycerol-3-phosphate acyltransferase 2, mitochondrial n=1 Tax=Apus apus TaxID=8895 RepID=UPI0021F8FFD5|nr:glycerol-3-phosphate acyltransferase 2, mitochondrial [Apus apus]
MGEIGKNGGNWMKTWICDSGQKLEIFIPFLGKSRPFSGRCCQICTPKSWGGFFHQQLSRLGFRDAARVTEKDTRFRGWLVRRVCVFLMVWNWKVPADTPRDLLERVCQSKRVQDAAGLSHGFRGDSESQQGWKEKVLEILAQIQAPLSVPTLRLCCWVLLKLLNRLFFGVQLHRGQLEMVLRATRTPGVPLVFVSRHQSQLDGLLLSFLLFSQGLGVPRVTVGAQPCSPHLRALLSRLGGVFLPWRTEGTRSNRDKELPEVVLAAYVEEVLRSQQALLIFLEEPQAPRQLSGPARAWLAALLRALRGRAVPDLLLLPVGIAYDLAPGGLQQGGEDPPCPLGLGSCLRALCRALRQPRGCARVDFAQPFSLQVQQPRISPEIPPGILPGGEGGQTPEFVAKNQVISRETLEELLLPTILGTCPVLPEAKSRSPSPTMATSLEKEEEMLVMKLGLHCLSDTMSCSAIMAVEIMSALLLYRHRQGVLLSRLMLDFSWLLEEILLRRHDVGFSGQLRAVVWHSLHLLRAHVTFYHLRPLGDVLVVPEVSAEAWRELGHHSAALLPVFACEAVGACAIRALLLELLPFLGGPPVPPGISLSQDELHQKTLELLQLLPPNLLGLQPCQPPECRSQDILDKLLLCGLLQAEEENEHWVCDVSLQPWPGVDFSDSDSDNEAPKRCFKVSEPPGCPGLLLFLCRLLCPVLRSFGGAAAFLGQTCWPQPEAACLEALLQFLAQEEGWGPPSRSLALSSLQTFKEMGVLEEVQTPTGPQLQLTQPFLTATNREKLEAFIHQFTQS